MIKKSEKKVKNGLMKRGLYFFAQRGLGIYLKNSQVISDQA